MKQRQYISPDQNEKSPLNPLFVKGGKWGDFRIKKEAVIITILFCAITASFGLPKVKYKSPQILPKLEIPYKMPGWLGKNMANEINPEDKRYNFIGDVFARAYLNKYGESLLFLILDAGNFHNPKVCFGGSGFKIRELPKLELKILNRSLKANVLYAQKGQEGLLLVYWICIDKKTVDWTEQKIKQLWYSLFNKEKVGLMVRLDIPVYAENLDSSLKLAREFISDISSKIPSEQADYIFGK